MKEVLIPKGIPILDLYEAKENSQFVEDYAVFESLFWKASSLDYDFIIATPHSDKAANSSVIKKLVSKLAKEHRRILFIENAPENIEDFDGYVSKIFSDSVAGAEAISSYLLRIKERNDNIVLISGPSFSRNSQVRIEVLKDRLAEAGIAFQIYQAENWNSESGKDISLPYLAKTNENTIFVCGNDNLALGVKEAMEANQINNHTLNHRIVGYDGLPRVLMEVWKSDSPIEATLRIPPINYGRRIGHLILNEMNSIKERPVATHVINIDSSNIVTKTSYDSLLGIL